MIPALLLVSLMMPQDTGLVVGPVYRNSALGIELPRPFDDWVFAPATERGTTTVIFHPRGSALSSNLWGVLIRTPWDGVPDPGLLADRRVQETWRRTFGSSFQLRARDTLHVAGANAVRLSMAGEIDQAVVDVDEFIIASGTDLVLLQFRIPRGVPRDSIEEGFARVLAGLRLRRDEVAPPVSGGQTGFTPELDQGHVVFEVPSSMRAVSSGALVAEVVRGDQRIMRYRPLLEDVPALYAVGRYTVEERQAGRLTMSVWRNADASVRVTTARDTTLAILARGWSRYWDAFGRLPLAELVVVETDWPFTRGGPGIVFLGADAAEPVLLKELARTWWGGFARASGPFAALTNEILPAWAPGVAGIAGIEGTAGIDASARAIENARRIDPARFRAAIRSLALHARQPESPNAFFAALGPAGQALRMTLFP